MFCLGSGCETSCLTKKSLDACIGGKFQFLISLFTLFYWSLIVGLNAMVIFNYISKKRSSCLDIIEFFSEIKITLKYPNESLNSKPIINWKSAFLRSVSRNDTPDVVTSLATLAGDWILPTQTYYVKHKRVSQFVLWTRPKGKRKNDRKKRITIPAMQLKTICLCRGRERTGKKIAI